MLTDEKIAQEEAATFWHIKKSQSICSLGYASLTYEIDSIVVGETKKFKLQFLRHLQSIVRLALNNNNGDNMFNPQICSQNVFNIKIQTFIDSKIEAIQTF